MDLQDHHPNVAALKFCWRLAHQLPQLGQLLIPAGEGVLQVLYDPVVADWDSPPFASQFGTHFLQHTDDAQDLLGKGDEQPAEEAEKALGPLAGVVALDAHGHLHHAPAQDDDANGPDAGEEEIPRLLTMVKGSSAAKAGMGKDHHRQSERRPQRHELAGRLFSFDSWKSLRCEDDVHLLQRGERE